MSVPDPKAHSQERFGKFAANYVASTGHAKGYELDRLLELANPQSAWRALDIATGGGHTALKLAPHVASMIASDLTPAMLNAAREFIVKQGASNVVFNGADAEQLPFPNSSFELVTCRIAPHHFPDPFRFVQECARVLKSGGTLVVQDLTVPDDERAARYVDAFERLRDPSHVRMYAPYEWEGMFLDAGLTIDTTEVYRRGANLVEWARAQDADEYVLERLRILLVQAPQPVAEWLGVREVGGGLGFDHVYVMMKGRKQ